MRLALKRLLALLLPALALTGCWGGNNWHQKLTVTVATPTGEVSGSAVTSVTLQFAGDTWLAAGAQYQGGYSGEAIAVEVAPGKYLFALMDERLKTLAIKVFVSPAAAGTPKKEDANAVEAMRAKRTLSSTDYPQLVTFTDIANPKTVKEVKPRNLAEVFGAGYSLKSITLEITDEPKTKGEIIKICKWLDNQNLIFVDWTKYPTGHPLRNLNWHSFRIGN